MGTLHCGYICVTLRYGYTPLWVHMCHPPLWVHSTAVTRPVVRRVSRVLSAPLLLSAQVDP
eukprot:4427982-Pyramimonas_sp.AAC.1